ncbi:circularly permuted type 2 ATP-grasp protein [Nocardia cyriacigeorgica]|uniref:circularly permuted type 2 ATP-grasp protein n=1 Tax=Nocardia cyriacigeorgica TaxID=135487 RepID=UPI0024559435|nr:circularly permuted type 2 ATP-grasp protein [Nocardia cyriacigeorgica]
MQDVPGTRARVAAEFDRYRAAGAEAGGYDECDLSTGGFYDELIDADGRVRRMWSELSADFVEIGPEGLDRLDGRVRRLVEDDGITYTAADGAAEPWRLDPIPLLVAADEWTRLESGVAQRSRVFDEVLTDIYGPRRLLTSGLLPPEVVFGGAGYVRAAHGITVPGRHQLFLHACDISRWSDGQYRVLADWAQAPSGAGYALADRRVVSAAVPGAFEQSSPRPLTPFARALRLMLIEAAPMADADEPVVVVLSPGVRSETAFDQAYLASTLGFPLVESADLVVRDGALWMRSLGTLKRVDVVLRRVDAEFADPLDLRPESRLGVVGLVEVLRRGAVTVVNTLGSGLLENPALAGFLPAIARSLFGEELELPGAPSYWGGDDLERAHLLARLDRLIIRSVVDGATIVGPRLSAEQRADLAARIDADGWQWVGQEPAQFSVAPAVYGAGGLASSPVGMRLFALARREGYGVMTGGLGQLRQRVEPGRSVIEVAAKDVWVRAAPAETAAIGEPGAEERIRPITPVVEAVSSPRVLSDLFWMGRYAERAESLVRLLIATQTNHQDFRYRPWLEGAGSVRLLLDALGRTTGIACPMGSPDGVEEVSATVTGPRSTTRLGTGTDMDAETLGKTGRQEDSADGGSDRVVESGTQTHTAGVHGYRYLVSLTVDRDRPGTLAHAIDRYASAARAVRDQLSPDTWMVVGAMERALSGFRERGQGPGAGSDPESALAAVHSLTLAGLLALSGIGAESMVRDTGWYVMDIGKRIERGLALTALLSATLTESGPTDVDRVLTEAVLRATESAVSYRRRHRDSLRKAAVAGLLLFDEGNPRSLAYQLNLIDTGLAALPGLSGSSRSQRVLADARRLLRRVDPADLDTTDAAGRRTELIELLDGVHLRLRKVAESLEATKLSTPVGIQPLWGNTRVVG